MKGRPFSERLGFALAGLRAAWTREASFRTHLAFAAAALVALPALRPAPIEWALVAITVALVLALERLNGALETVIDRLRPGRHREIGIAKDMLAAAVLVAALAAPGVATARVVDTLEILR